MKIINAKNILLCTLVGAVSVNAEIKSIEKSLDSALNNHPIVQSEKYDLSGKKLDVKIAEGEYKPKIELSTEYGSKNYNTKNQGESSFTKNKYRGGHNIELKLTQNVFNGFYDESRINETKTLVTSAEHKLAQTENKLSFDTASAFLNIIKYREVLKSEKRALKQFEKYYKLALNKSKATGKKTDVINVNSKYKKIQNSVEQNEWLLIKAQEEFKQLTGEYLSEDAVVRKLSYINSYDKKKLLSKIKLNRNLLKIKSDVSSKVYKLKQNEASLYPKLDLEAKSNRNEDLNNFQGETRESSLLLKMTYNLYNGGIDTTKIEKSKIEKLKTNSDYEKVLVELEESALVQYAQYKSSQKRLNILLDYVKSQYDLVSLYETEFKVGKRTIVNLVDAEQDLKEARNNYTRTYIDYIRSTYDIAFKLGIIVDEIKNKKTEKVDYMPVNMAKSLLNKKPANVKKVVTNIDKSKYTISIATFKHKNHARKFVEKNFKNNRNIKILQIPAKNITYSKVVYGFFENKNDANKVLKNISDVLRKKHAMSVASLEKYKKYI